MTSVTISAPPLQANSGRKRPVRRVLPGFNLRLGYTLFYLSLIVLIPLSALLLKTFSLTWVEFWAALASPRVVASYKLTFVLLFLLLPLAAAETLREPDAWSAIRLTLITAAVAVPLNLVFGVILCNEYQSVVEWRFEREQNAAGAAHSRPVACLGPCQIKSKHHEHRNSQRQQRLWHLPRAA